MLNLKAAIRAEQRSWEPVVARSTVDIEPNSHITEVRERPGLRRWWTSSRLYHPQDMVAALLLAYYPNLPDLYLVSHDEQECAACGMLSTCSIERRLQDCVLVQLNVEALMGHMRLSVGPFWRHNALWWKIWNGWVVEEPLWGVKVVLQWSRPKDAMRWICAWRAVGAGACPLFHASFPSDSCQHAMVAMM